MQIEASSFDARLDEESLRSFATQATTRCFRPRMWRYSMGDEGKNLYVRTFSGEEDERMVKEENTLTGKVVYFQGPKGSEVERKNKNKKKGMHGRQRQRARRREAKNKAAAEEEEQEQEEEEQEEGARAFEAECVVVVEEEEEEEEAEGSKGECCVCSEKHGEYLKILVPCGHKCICQGCMDLMVAKAAPDPMRCPFCMVPVICHLDKVYSV